MINQQQKLRVKTTWTKDGYRVEMDTASWAELMVALGIAIDHSDQERAASLRKLRSALSRG